MLYERNLKIKDTNELTHNPEKDSQTYKINLWLLGAKDSQGFGVSHIHIAIFKMDNQQRPTVQNMEFCSM